MTHDHDSWLKAFNEGYEAGRTDHQAHDCCSPAMDRTVRPMPSGPSPTAATADDGYWVTTTVTGTR